MIQQIIAFALLGAACSYTGYRVYSSLRKKKACDSCALMKAAKSGEK